MEGRTSRVDSSAIPTEWSGGGHLLHSGFLIKKGHLVGNWKERYFELRGSAATGGHKLSYFTEQHGGSQKAKGEINMKGAIVVLTQPPIGVIAPWYTFEVVTSEGVRYPLRTRNAADRLIWFESLKSVSAAVDLPPDISTAVSTPAAATGGQASLTMPSATTSAITSSSSSPPASSSSLSSPNISASSSSSFASSSRRGSMSQDRVKLVEWLVNAGLKRSAPAIVAFGFESIADLADETLIVLEHELTSEPPMGLGLDREHEVPRFRAAREAAAQAFEAEAMARSMRETHIGRRPAQQAAGRGLLPAELSPPLPPSETAAGTRLPNEVNATTTNTSSIDDIQISTMDAVPPVAMPVSAMASSILNDGTPRSPPSSLSSQQETQLLLERRRAQAKAEEDRALQAAIAASVQEDEEVSAKRAAAKAAAMSEEEAAMAEAMAASAASAAVEERASSLGLQQVLFDSSSIAAGTSWAEAHALRQAEQFDAARAAFISARDLCEKAIAVAEELNHGGGGENGVGASSGGGAVLPFVTFVRTEQLESLTKMSADCAAAADECFVKAQVVKAAQGSRSKEMSKTQGKLTTTTTKKKKKKGRIDDVAEALLLSDDDEEAIDSVLSQDFVTSKVEGGDFQSEGGSIQSDRKGVVLEDVSRAEGSDVTIAAAAAAVTTTEGYLVGDEDLSGFQRKAIATANLTTEEKGDQNDKKQNEEGIADPFQSAAYLDISSDEDENGNDSEFEDIDEDLKSAR